MGRTKDFSDLDTAVSRTKKPAPDTGATDVLSKGLTIKLTEAEYQRLRTYAFMQKRTHQDICRTAIMTYLDSAGG